jgi:glucose/arabinose dehydrogenase
MVMRKASLLLLFATLIAACPKSPVTGSGGATGTGGHKDAGSDVHLPPPADGPLVDPCKLPGSVQFTADGTVTVPGGDPSWPSLAFLQLPMGFCAHYYGTVDNARQLRFAPGGELFVASPTTGTTGGGFGGLSAIVVLPDYDLDGIADATVTYQGGLPSTQGLLFANDHLYYQDHTMIMRVPYAKGDLSPSGPADMVANITYYSDAQHWPKALDIADDGSIYVGNGGSQRDVCTFPHPFWGGIRKIDPTGTNLDGIPIAQGFRNPIAVRCARGKNQCFALELALDYSYPPDTGREKMVPIRQGDDWGYPCCASKNLPYNAQAGTDCSGVAQDNNAFFIGNTPFGVDFEPGLWPGTWAGRAYVVLHGEFGSFKGARMVAIPMDPTTGLPLPSTSAIDGSNVGMVDFATGWDVGNPRRGLGRPAAVAFSPDGRLFVGNDNNGMIFWIAPLGT